MRLPARLLLTGAALLVSASCVGDSNVAPKPVPSVAGNPALKALVVAQSVDLVIPAAGGQLDILGVYNLSFPAGAVCDPNAADTQAGYAAGEWDAPCTPATGDIAIRATAKWSGGKLYVDFQPSLRFVPSKTVTLSTSIFAPVVQFLHEQGWTEGYTIPFATAIEGTEIADALTDPSVRTRLHANSGKISRRIKHFTGYVLTGGPNMGMPCDPADGDPLCQWVEDE